MWSFITSNSLICGAYGPWSNLTKVHSLPHPLLVLPRSFSLVLSQLQSPSLSLSHGRLRRRSTPPPPTPPSLLASLAPSLPHSSAGRRCQVGWPWPRTAMSSRKKMTTLQRWDEAWNKLFLPARFTSVFFAHARPSQASAKTLDRSGYSHFCVLWMEASISRERVSCIPPFQTITNVRKI